jgi:amidase
VDPFLPAHRFASLLRARRIGCLELLDLYLKRVERCNQVVNAVCVLDVERARKRARAADRALARKETWGPLHGVPMTIKESFDVASLPTTWGRPELKENIASRDALAVERLQRAGAIIFGKTNVPTLLADWQTFNPIYGTTNNPWDLTRVPGGSSGGSAAALAAGLTALECGSDIGASIRNPAHYCGVFGHKPTYGICAPTGQTLPPFISRSDISVIGPLARSARDLEIALAAILGPDSIDGRGWQVRLPADRPRVARPKAARRGIARLKPPVDFARGRRAARSGILRARYPFAGWRVAVMRTSTVADVDATIQERIQAVADFVAGCGAKVADATPEIDAAEANRVYITLLRAATARSQSDETFARHLETARKAAPADDSYRTLMARGATITHRDWLAVDEARQRMRQKWMQFFESWDVLLCPAAATAAFPHNQRGERWERMIEVNGRPQPSTTQLFWAGFSGVAYLPSTVAPAGSSPEGLPIGIQIVGPEYGDLTTIAFARLLEREFYAFVPPPGY